MIHLLSSVAALAAPLFGLGGSASMETSAQAAPTQEPPHQMEATVQQVKRGAPFLWTLEGPEGRAYLFGTIHLPDERVLALPKVVAAALRESKAYYSEIESSSDVQKESQEAAMLPSGTKLSTLVGQATWDRVVARLAKKKVDDRVAQGMEAMKPWAVSSILPALDYLPAQMAGQLPLDHQLYLQAQAEGKTVGGLETVQEQVGIFTRLSPEEQSLMLRETLDMLDRFEAEGKDAMQETIRAWLSGKESALLELMKESFGHDEALKKRLEKELLWDRNRVLAERISSRFKANAGTVSFFAVGALHMPDAPKPTSAEKAAAAAREEGQPQKTATQRRMERKLGLVSLLRAKGFRVTRVNVPSTLPTASAGK